MTTQTERTVDQSWALYDHAQNLIPMATQTHSKAPREALRGIEPCYVVSGKGGRVQDLDGNEYIDFRLGLGPVTLGYAFPAVNEAIRAQLEKGIVFPYSHPLEVEVAERLITHIPCAERVRFLKTGGEAMAATFHLSRAFTGRDIIITCGYHGWINSLRDGTPKAVKSVYQRQPWGDATPFAEAFAANPDKIAAVSVACDYANIEAGATFLSDLRTLTEQHGALLIFDEIVTGFRLRIGGAQEYFDVTPDLSVFAKGISNGMPLSCYLGRADIMDCVKQVTISSTFGGDTLSLAASRAVIDTYNTETVIDTLWARGQQLHAGLLTHAQRLNVPLSFKGLPPLGQLTFDHPNKDL
ncbi:MAG: aminotransferase class III-fold pyridoxal phosphate-dependent enzyme, partial [Candidatus Latescibacteria bacterium]|nr:aminotransferase class III-fold pyridoxal phosphate-dependent enzyme [Candidatus Latescibacterota bacterium]